MKKQIDISITIPVYNSAEILPELNERLHHVLKGESLSFEIVYVDDDSQDHSWEVLTSLKEKFEDSIKIIRLDRNFGQHQALICAFNFSTGNLVLTMDDDLQHPPEEIPKLIQAYRNQESAVTYGVYKVKQHGVAKSTSSFLIQKSSKYFSDHAEGVGSSFRLFRRELIDKICEKPQNFIFIDEIIHWYTSDIQTVEVEHHPRKSGKSTYTRSKRTKLYLDIIVNYSAWPLRLMINIGAIAAILSLLAAIFFIIKRIFFHVRVEGFTITIVIILFSTSLILITLGIIGKYLFKIYQNQSGKPPYSVKNFK